ncbi:MAG: alpha/beta hydrolase [Ruminococcaceae bacterium]|nr:alpha/beta hydrolase [Oscillospiraceae bacterium]
MFFINIGVVLVLVLFFGSLIAYLMAFYQTGKQKNKELSLPNSEQYKEAAGPMNEMVQELLKEPFEEIYIESFDGLKLYGRYYHRKDGAPLQIMFHGYRAKAERDFCGGSKFSRERDYNAIIVDQRAHGKSGGHTIAFGLKERYDVLSWVNYANRRFGTDTKILLYGLSMGSATVIMASGLNLPKNVVGIVADCPYSSPVDIIKKVIKDMCLPPMVLYPFVFLGALIFGRLNLKETTCEKEVKKSRIPILIFHGEDDRFVPNEMSAVIHEANKEMVERHSFPDAGHGISFIKDPVRYKKALTEFWERVLK